MVLLAVFLMVFCRVFRVVPAHATSLSPRSGLPRRLGRLRNIRSGASSRLGRLLSLCQSFLLVLFLVLFVLVDDEHDFLRVTLGYEWSDFGDVVSAFMPVYYHVFQYFFHRFSFVRIVVFLSGHSRHCGGVQGNRR